MHDRRKITGVRNGNRTIRLAVDSLSWFDPRPDGWRLTQRKYPILPPVPEILKRANLGVEFRGRDESDPWLS